MEEKDRTELFMQEILDSIDSGIFKYYQEKKLCYELQMYNSNLLYILQAMVLFQKIQKENDK